MFYCEFCVGVHKYALIFAIPLIFQGSEVVIGPRSCIYMSVVDTLQTLLENKFILCVIGVAQIVLLIDIFVGFPSLEVLLFQWFSFVYLFIVLLNVEKRPVSIFNGIWSIPLQFLCYEKSLINVRGHICSENKSGIDSTFEDSYADTSLDCRRFGSRAWLNFDRCLISIHYFWISADEFHFRLLRILMFFFTQMNKSPRYNKGIANCEKA